MEPVLAAIGHTTVHTVLKKVMKELDNQFEKELVQIVISAPMEKIAKGEKLA